MSSGIEVGDEFVMMFEDFKLKKTQNKYMVFKIEYGKKKKDPDTFIFEAGYPAEMALEEFVTLLPENDGRFVLVDFDYDSVDGRACDKLFLVTWIPEYSNAKHKMIYSTTKAAVQSSFQGIADCLNVTGVDEFTEEIMLAKARSI